MATLDAGHTETMFATLKGGVSHTVGVKRADIECGYYDLAN